MQGSFGREQGGRTRTWVCPQLWAWARAWAWTICMGWPITLERRLEEAFGGNPRLRLQQSLEPLSQCSHRQPAAGGRRRGQTCAAGRIGAGHSPSLPLGPLGPSGVLRVLLVAVAGGSTSQSWRSKKVAYTANGDPIPSSTKKVPQLHAIALRTVK